MRYGDTERMTKKRSERVKLMSQCLQSARVADRLSNSHGQTISDLALPLAAPASGICRADRAAVGEGLSTGHTVFTKSTK